MLIRPCRPGEEPQILSVINDGAGAYRGVIPAGCWKDPYMPEGELRAEIAAGVAFWCAEVGGGIAGVMGLQHVRDVSLVRHSYVRTVEQGKGAGKALLTRILAETSRPVLAGTWAAAEWAVRFYIRNGFTLLPRTDGEILLHNYWSIPDRQVASSVVLADRKWAAKRESGRN